MCSLRLCPTPYTSILSLQEKTSQKTKQNKKTRLIAGYRYVAACRIDVILGQFKIGPYKIWDLNVCIVILPNPLVCF